MKLESLARLNGFDYQEHMSSVDTELTVSLVY